MKSRGFAAALVAGAGVLGSFTGNATAQDDNVFKLAFVAFLSGQAAESFGKPAVKFLLQILRPNTFGERRRVLLHPAVDVI